MNYTKDYYWQGFDAHTKEKIEVLLNSLPKKIKKAGKTYLLTCNWKMSWISAMYVCPENAKSKHMGINDELLISTNYRHLNEYDVILEDLLNQCKQKGLVK